jgi:hypothetical protein
MSVTIAYAGQRFQSEMDVRWAVLFDQLDIAWQYRPELTDAERRYLPDFAIYLPQPVWFMIQPLSNRATRGDRGRWRGLILETGRHLIGAFGFPDPDEPNELDFFADVYCPRVPHPVEALGAVFEANSVGLDWADMAAGTTVRSIADSMALPQWDASAGLAYCDEDMALHIECDCMPGGYLRCGDYAHPRILAAYRTALHANFGPGGRSR